MRFFMRILVFTLIAIAACIHPAWAAAYRVDPDHTTISFKIRHLFSWVQGTFNEFEGTLEYGPGDPGVWSAAGTIQAASIDTRVAMRDKHLRSADFFDVEKFPTLSFKTAKIENATDTHATVSGLLTVHGVEQPVVLEVDIFPVVKDPWGNVTAGFSADATINRKDFGLTWNQTLETGGVLVGDEVQITLDISAIQQE